MLNCSITSKNEPIIKENSAQMNHHNSSPKTKSTMFGNLSCLTFGNPETTPNQNNSIQINCSSSDLNSNEQNKLQRNFYNKGKGFNNSQPKSVSTLASETDSKNQNVRKLVMKQNAQNIFNQRLNSGFGIQENVLPHLDSQQIFETKHNKLDNIKPLDKEVKSQSGLRQGKCNFMNKSSNCKFTQYPPLFQIKKQVKFDQLWHNQIDEKAFETPNKTHIAIQKMNSSFCNNQLNGFINFKIDKIKSPKMFDDKKNKCRGNQLNFSFNPQQKDISRNYSPRSSNSSEITKENLINIMNQDEVKNPLSKFEYDNDPNSNCNVSQPEKEEVNCLNASTINFNILN